MNKSQKVASARGPIAVAIYSIVTTVVFLYTVDRQGSSDRARGRTHSVRRSSKSLCEIIPKVEVSLKKRILKLSPGGKY